MKRYLFFIGALGLTMSLSAADVRIERNEGGGGGGGGNSSPSQPSHQQGRQGQGAGGRRSRGANPPVVIKMQRYSMPRPDVIRHSRNIVRDQKTAVVPQRDEHGTTIQQRATVIAPQHHTVIAHNPTIIRNIQHEQRVEIVPNRYYWHTVNGIRYSHYYDHGIHWYGFYHGPTFYWTRYYGNRWWWFDVGFNRWVYWWDGYWWWPSPAGPLYVYVDNSYYPYDEEEGVVTVRRPEVQAAPASTPSTASEGASEKSPDGKRLVQVYGAQSEAFLYDASGAQPVFLKYLAQGVSKVRFSGGSNGKPSQILLDFKDGNFALYSQDGDPLDATPDAADNSLPTSPPPGPTTPSNSTPPPASPDSTPQ